MASGLASYGSGQRISLRGQVPVMVDVILLTHPSYILE